jgi:tRNA (guanine37-N1)-methyltransferase
MVTCLKVPKEKAEQVRQLLLSKKIFSGKFRISREGTSVLFPINSDRVADAKAIGIGVLEELPLPPLASKPDSIYDALEGKMSEKERQALITSFDIVGDIAVLEIPDELSSKKKEIADAVFEVHGNIRVVAKKMGATSGEFRIRPVKVIAGESRTDTLCKESGCVFHLDINKTYFSGRLSTERLRIASMVKKGENILALFAGIGPFPIVIEKNSKARPKKQVAVELNPDAFAFMEENIALNKCKTIEAIEGDAAKVLSAPRFSAWADRAIMPLPKSGAEFLQFVLPCMKKGGIVHFYFFGDGDSPYALAEKAAKETASECGRKISISGRRIVRPYSPGTVQAVLDLSIS